MTDSARLLDQALDALFGNSSGDCITIAPADVYVDVVILPTRNLSEARAAAALQLDRLCPLDAASACFDLIALDEFGSGSQGRFLLGVVSQATLDSARDGAEGPYDAFSVEIEHEGGLHLFLFRDAHARSTRRRRRVMTLAAAVALLAAVAWSAGESRGFAHRTEAARVAAIAEAQVYLEQSRQRQRRLQAAQSELAADRTDDVAARFVRTLAALSDPPVEDLSITTLSVDMNGATIAGAAANPELVRPRLSERPDMVITSFSAAPVDPSRTGRSSVEIRLRSPGAPP